MADQDTKKRMRLSRQLRRCLISQVVYRRRPTRLFIYAPFVVLYAISFQWCWNTAGTPYRNAIAHATARNVAQKINTGFATAVIEDDDEEDEDIVQASVGDVGQGKAAWTDEDDDIAFPPSPPPPKAAPEVAGAVNETAIVEAMQAQERKVSLVIKNPTEKNSNPR